MILHLLVSSVIFAVFYALIFMFLNKVKVFKITFVHIFVVTLVLYFVLTLILSRILNF